jgi:hypothetical protein
MATIAQLEAGVKAAYDAGNMEYVRILGAELVRARKDPVNQIPGMQVQDPQETTPSASIGDTLAGAAEAALTVGTGLVGAVVGAPVGLVRGIGSQIVSGTMGTQEGLRQTQQSVSDAMEAMTYQPRGQVGQEMVGAIGKAAEVLPPFIPLIGQAGMIGESARAAMPMAIATGQRVAQPVQQAAQKAAQSIRNVGSGAAPAMPGFGPGSIGAADLSQARQRLATAQNMPVPFTGDASPTMGMLTRNQDVLQFEKETAKTPAGAPLRERVGNISAVASKNFEVLIDRIDPAATELRQLGKNVDQVLKTRMGVINRQISAAYKAADEAGELLDPVAMTPLAPVMMDLDRFKGVAPNVGAIQNEAVRLGALIPDGNGGFKPGRIDLGNSELMRQFVNQATDWTDKRQAMVAKRTNEAIDMATEGKGGELYKKARALHKGYVKEFENVGLTRKLTTTKRGTDERQVAYEDVFQKIIVDAPLEELNKVRSTLLRAGPEGGRAWQDLKAQGIQYIKDRAYSKSATDERGNPVMLPDAMVKTVKQLDVEGKLEALYGKKQAQVLRDLAELSQVIYTAPPGAVNSSGTSSAIITAMDTVATFGTVGIPVPAVTVLREASKYVRDKKVKARINQSLNFAQETQP